MSSCELGCIAGCSSSAASFFNGTRISQLFLPGLSDSLLQKCEKMHEKPILMRKNKGRPDSAVLTQ